MHAERPHSGLRTSIGALDSKLEAWARLVTGRPLATLAASVAATVVLATGLARLEVVASTESLLRHDDPARARFEQFRTEFDPTEPLILVLRADDVFRPRFVERLAALHADLDEHLPYTRKVTSLLNARTVEGNEEGIAVSDLLDGWPLGAAELEQARAKALANPLYRNVLLSEDGHHTSVRVELAGAGRGGFSTEQSEEIVRRLEAIIDRHAAHDFPIWAAGPQPVTVAILRALRSDLLVFSLVATIVTGVLLLALFRSLICVALPLLTVALSLVGTFGLMGLAGVPVTPASQIIPSFVLAVGVANCVHVLNGVLARIAREASTGDAATRDLTPAVVGAIAHCGFAIVMTGLTTAACLSSFLFTDLALLSSFGFSSAAGVLLALSYALTMLPALLVLCGRVGRMDRVVSNHYRIERLLGRVARYCTTKPRAVVLAWVLIGTCGLAGAAGIRFQHEPVAWLADRDGARVAVDVANRHLRAGDSYELVLDTGVENGLYEPASLRVLDEMRAIAERGNGILHVGRAISVADVVKEVHQALNEGSPSHFRIPDSRPLVAQELLLFEMSGADDVATMVDGQLRQARMTITIPMIEGFALKRHVAELERRLRSVATPAGELTITGNAHLNLRTVAAIVTSMAKSYAVALAALLPLMIFLTGEVRLGLISMLPNVVPILLALAVMRWLGLPLDMFSILIGGVALGISVDDTIHLVHDFRRRHHHGHDPCQAMHETLLSTGRAVVFTSIILASAFAVFIAASMSCIASFGLITALAVTVALAADTTLTPALIVLTHRANRGALQTGPDTALVGTIERKARPASAGVAKARGQLSCEA